MDKSNPDDYAEFIKKRQEEAKAKGVTLSQMYLRKAETQYRKIEKKIPYLWKAIMGKKYLIPQYRQADYVNPDVYSYLLLDQLVAVGRGLRDTDVDNVVKTHYISFLRQLEHDRPTYWLEKELAGPMVRTKLSEDFIISDVKWKWPCFRVYLPHGTLTITRDGKVSNIVYLDILRIEANSKYTLPVLLKTDLWRLDAYFNPTMSSDEVNGFAVSGVLDLDDPDSSIGYAGTAPLDNTTIATLMHKKGHDLNLKFASDPLDDALVQSMMHLAFVILIGMSTPPPEYDLPPGASVIRKPRKEGDRTIPGLYHAKFIGETMFKPRRVAGAPHPSSLPGYHLDPMWRAGHLKRVWYGPKKSQSRLQWIGLYHTGAAEDAGPPPKDKLDKEPPQL